MHMYYVVYSSNVYSVLVYTDTTIRYSVLCHVTRITHVVGDMMYLPIHHVIQYYHVMCNDIIHYYI